MRLLLLITLVGGSLCHPFAQPNDDVSLADIEGTADTNARYGNDGQLTQEQLDSVKEIFGIVDDNDNNDNQHSNSDSDGPYNDSDESDKNDNQHSNINNNNNNSDGPYTDESDEHIDDHNSNEQLNNNVHSNNNNNNNVHNNNNNNDADPYDGDSSEQQIQKETKVDTKYDQCSHPYYKEQGYACVPYYQCDEDYGVIITDGEGGIDIRFGGDQDPQAAIDPLLTKCPGAIEVCCLDEYYEPPPKPSTTTQKPAPITDKPDYSSTTTTEYVPPHPTTKRPKPTPKPIPYKSKCGRRNTDGIGVRIQSSDPYVAETQFGEWPHMCALLKVQYPGGEPVNLYQCGASLISEDTVLTGAHCVDELEPTDELVVRCGEWDTQQPVEFYPHEDRKVSSYTIHPEYLRSGPLFYDFAVLHMEKPFLLGPHIDTICLPDTAYDKSQYLQEHCYATGWGKDEFGAKGRYQVIMKQIDLPIMDNYKCQENLRTTRLGSRFRLHESFICAGGEEGKDTCKGDGGGPLVCPFVDEEGETRYMQSGITAWGIGCGQKDIPGVYADITKGLCFIEWEHKCNKNSNRFEFLGCENWRTGRVAELKNLIESGNLKRRELKKTQIAYEAMKNAFSDCKWGKEEPHNPYNEDDDDYDGFDDLQRKGEVKTE